MDGRVPAQWIDRASQVKVSQRATSRVNGQQSLPLVQGNHLATLATLATHNLTLFSSWKGHFSHLSRNHLIHLDIYYTLFQSTSTKHARGDMKCEEKPNAHTDALKSPKKCPHPIEKLTVFATFAQITEAFFSSNRSLMTLVSRWPRGWASAPTPPRGPLSKDTVPVRVPVPPGQHSLPMKR